MPAKAAILNIKQFDGEYECLHCFHPGSHLHEYSKRVYLPNAEQENLKSDSSFKQMVKLASEKGKCCFGVIGSNPLSAVIDIPSQVPLDYMHLVLHGHTKWLLNQFFNSSKDNEFNISHKIDILNSKLKLIQRPHSITRKICSLFDYHKWKASELKLFLLYLSIPMFLNALPTRYFYLISCYVIAIRHMYEPIEDENNLVVAENIIQQYFDSLQYEFGDYAHLHLPNQIRYHGPLKSNSQFVFEGAIFNTKRVVNGTTGFLNQIVNQINNEREFATFIEKTSFNNDKVKHYTEKIIDHKSNITSNNTRLHNISNKKLNGMFLECFLNFFQMDFYHDSILFSERICYNKTILHSTKITIEKVIQIVLLQLFFFIL